MYQCKWGSDGWNTEEQMERISRYAESFTTDNRFDSASFKLHCMFRGVPGWEPEGKKSAFGDVGDKTYVQGKTVVVWHTLDVVTADGNLDKLGTDNIKTVSLIGAIQRITFMCYS